MKIKLPQDDRHWAILTRVIGLIAGFILVWSIAIIGNALAYHG